MPIPQRRKGEKRSDFIQRCMSDPVMKREYPKSDQRLAICSQAANKRSNTEDATGAAAGAMDAASGRHNRSGTDPHDRGRTAVVDSNAERVGLYILARADTEAIREDTFEGRTHTVVPVVALVEGVLHPSNAPRPELALASEFAPFPEGWNGRPVVLDHPVRNGLKVSANSPDVLEEEAFGSLFNSRLEGKKLLSEIWIDHERVEKLDRPEINAAIERLKSGEIVEVSTGLFTHVEPTAGRYNGEEFFGIWRDVVPDHLAILPEGKRGACSAEDGCGAPRANEGHNATQEPAMATARDVNEHSQGLRTVPDGIRVRFDCQGEEGCQEIIIYNSEKPEEGDAAQTIETLEMPEIRSASEATRVASAYLRVLRGEIPKSLEESNTERQANIARGLVSFLKQLGGKLRGQVRRSGMSDRDVRAAIESALATMEPDKFQDVIAVFDDSFVVARFDGLFRRSFDIAEDGTITVGSDLVRVRPETEFVPVEVQEENGMDKTQRVNALIANESTKFTEDQREWLMSLSAEQLELLEPVQETPNSPSGQAESPEAAEDTASSPQTQSTTETGTETGSSEAPTTAEAYISAAPPEVRELLESGLQLHRSRKEALVKGLSAHPRNDFTEQELRDMSLRELERLARLAGGPTYLRAATGQDPVAISTNDRRAPTPPKAFEPKQVGSGSSGDSAQAS